MAATIWIVDSAGNTRGTILPLSWTAVPKFNDVGTWTVTCILDERHAVAATQGWRVMIADETGLYGGLRTKAVISFDGRRFLLTLSGEDDNRWLRARMAWPVPANALSAQTSAYDVRTGQGSTKLIEYANVNCGPGARAERRVAGLTMGDDPGIGGTGTGRARFKTVLEVERDLAIATAVAGVPLGFRVDSTLGLAKTFNVYLPRDLTGPARFSVGLRNLKTLKWTDEAPDATTIIAGGRGEETARSFIGVPASVSADETTWGRAEDFYDGGTSSDSDANAELTQNATTALVEKAAKQSVEVEPRDTPRWSFGRDRNYWLGDRVTVGVYGGITMDGVILSAEISEDRTGSGPVRTVKPFVGDIGASRTPAQWRRTVEALARVKRLETR